MSGRARKSSSPPGTAPRAGSSAPASRSASSSDVTIDAEDVARQARAATGGGRANIAGAVTADGVLRVLGSTIGPIDGAWRRALELARDGQRAVVVEVDVNGNARIHTDPEGAVEPIDVALGEGRSA